MYWLGVLLMLLCVGLPWLFLRHRFKNLSVRRFLTSLVLTSVFAPGALQLVYWAPVPVPAALAILAVPSHHEGESKLLYLDDLWNWRFSIVSFFMVGVMTYGILSLHAFIRNRALQSRSRL
jgi:hypothetical protein